MAVRRYLGHKPAVIATVILLIMILYVVLAPITARYGVNEAVFQTTADQSNRYLPPQSVAWFGTDEIGRDLYSRLIYGTQVSLQIGLAAAIIGVVLGAAVGAVAGLHGGRFDDVMMRVTDIFLAFPFLVALLVTRNMLGELPWLTPIIGERTSIRFVIFLLAIFGWMTVARIVRGQVLALEGARVHRGVTGGRGVQLPHRRSPPAAQLDRPDPRGAHVLGGRRGHRRVDAELLRLRAQLGSGQTSLGNLVGSSKENVLSGHWWMVVFPCVTLMVLTLVINFVGDGLRDATDPKLQRGGSR